MNAESFMDRKIRNCPCFLGRFQLRTMLLAFLVVATLCEVFVRRRPKATKLGSSLQIETNYVPHSPPVVGTLVRVPPGEDGPWRLRDLGGRLLIAGHHQRDIEQGVWRCFDDSGRCITEGSCEQGRMVGQWTSRTATGKLVCTAEFGLWQVGTSDPALGYLQYELAVRHGSAIWWSPAGTVEQHIIYDHDLRQDLIKPPISTGRSALAFSQAERDQLDSLIDSPRYRDRCQAIRMLREHQTDALSTLVRVVKQSNHPARRSALLCIADLGTKAASARDLLEPIAQSPDDPLAAEAARALMEVDPTKRTKWAEFLFEHALTEPVPRAKHFRRTLLRNPMILAEELAPVIHDNRREARRLMANMLMISFHTIHGVMSCERLSDLDLQECYEFPQILGSWNSAFRESRRAYPLLTQLDAMSADPDPEIQSDVKEFAFRWRNPGFVEFRHVDIR